MPRSTLPLFEVISENNRYFERSSKRSIFVIERNNWNDYWYYTAYTLYQSAVSLNADNDKLIGHLKILKKGQTTNTWNLIEEGLYNHLDDEFCSMGAELDYYQRLSDLEPQLRDRVLSALNDVINDQNIRDEFNEEPGFQKSLMRDRKDDDDIFEMGKLIIDRNIKALFDLDLNLEFSMPGLLEPIRFDFSNPEVMYNNILPERISVLIGRNGSGKSTILSRISRIASSLPQDRKDQALREKIGFLLPEGVGFPRVIVLSYSPFDSFNTPGTYISHKRRIATEIKHGLGSYMFCGTRNIVKELELSLDSMESKASNTGRLSEEDIIRDRIQSTILKSSEELGREFSRNMEMIFETRNIAFLSPVLEILRQEQTLNSLLPANYEKNGAGELQNFFNDLSTGHKFVVHAMSSVIASAAPRSLLLFDEPETHLHPPMLAVLMKALRYVLDQTNSYMLVATHSPVVLQETMAKQVFVVKREGKNIRVFQPDLETFGENVGILTQTAFGLSSDISQYHDVLDRLIEKVLRPSDNLNIESMLEIVEENFEKGLSMQARSYVMSQLANRLND